MRIPFVTDKISYRRNITKLRAGNIFFFFFESCFRKRFSRVVEKGRKKKNRNYDPGVCCLRGQVKKITQLNKMKKKNVFVSLRSIELDAIICKNDKTE